MHFAEMWERSANILNSCMIISFPISAISRRRGAAHIPCAGHCVLCPALVPVGFIAISAFVRKGDRSGSRLSHRSMTSRQRVGRARKDPCDLKQAE